MTDELPEIDLALVPDLPTRVGLPGTIAHAEACGGDSDTGVYVALLIYRTDGG